MIHRLRQLAPWVRARSGRPYRAEAARDMAVYWSQVDTNYAGLTNSFAYYQRLIEMLERMADLELRPMRRFFDPVDDGQRVIGLRHDIDADPITALRMARHLARYGICGSFYLLHTALYYGDWHGSVFVRNPQLPEWVRSFIATGAELGLHNDAMGVTSRFSVNGADAVRQELAYLRSLGAEIHGTVAHNSFPSYNAENYEVFAEHRLWSRRVRTEAGHPLPLGALSMQSLGLTYEGTCAEPHDRPNLTAIRAFVHPSNTASIRDESWMKRYLTDNPYCRWRCDYQLWLLGRDRWVVGGRTNGQPVFHDGLALADVGAWLRQTPRGTRTLAVIHPVYLRGD